MRLVPRIAERLDREHPYESSGIVAVPILAGSIAYAAWVNRLREP